MPLLPEMNRIIPGRQKAIKTAAEVCMPGVWVNISMLSPRKNDDISKIQPGVSKGRSRINITYR
jgi:hypothetical protein